jgi:parvulin-like peptidyl-prolyl isomerase
LNQVSDVITTRMGYYLVEVLERMPAGKAPLEKVTEEIRNFLLTQEVEKRLPAWIEQLKQEQKQQTEQKDQPPWTGGDNVF